MTLFKIDFELHAYVIHEPTPLFHEIYFKIVLLRSTTRHPAIATAWIFKFENMFSISHRFLRSLLPAIINCFGMHF